MKIDSFHIDGFGVFQDRRLNGLAPRLSLFVGPNESGKSTLLAFLRFMFFGFPDKRTKANRYPPLQSGLPHGGQLVLAASSGKYLLDRHDSLDLLLPNSVKGNDKDLEELLGGITRETFNNVFAFSLWELQRLHDAFGQGAVNEALYSATAGLDHQLLTAAEDFLNDGMAQLFKKRSRKAAINTALNDLEDLQNEIRSTQDTLAEFERLCSEVSALEGSIRTYQERQTELNVELESLKELISLRDQRAKRNSDLNDCRSECETLRQKRSDIHLDVLLYNMRVEVQDLLKDRGKLIGISEQKPELQRDLETARHDFATCVSKLGPDWTVDRIESYNISPTALSEIAGKEGALRDSEIAVAEARTVERKALEDQTSAIEKESQAAKTFEQLAEPPPQLDLALLEQLQTGRGDYDRATRDLRAREVELRDAEADLSRSLADINPLWTEKDLEGFDSSLPAQQKLQALRDDLIGSVDETDEELQQFERAQDACRKADERQRAMQQKLNIAACPPYAEPAVMRNYREARERLYVSFIGTAALGTYQWGPLVVVLLGSILAISWWLFLPFPAAGTVVGSASFLVGGWLWKRNRARRTAFERLNHDFSDFGGKLGVDLPLSTESFKEFDVILDSATEAFHQRDFLSQQVTEATRLVSEAQQELTKRQDALRSAETLREQKTDNWRRYLSSIGLAVTISADSVGSLLSRIEICRERLEKIRDLRHRIDAMERNRDEYLKVLNQLLAVRGQIAATNADAPIRIAQFLDSVRKEDELRRHRNGAQQLWMHASEERRQKQESLLQATRNHQQVLERQQALNAERRDWLDKHFLPMHILPGGAGEFLRNVDQARRALTRTRELEEKLRALTGSELDIAGRLRELLTSSRRSFSNNYVGDMDLLDDALKSAEETAQKIAVLEARIEEKQRQMDTINADVDEVTTKIAKLQCSIPDGDLTAHRYAIMSGLSELQMQIEEHQNHLAECRSRRQASSTDERLSNLYERQASIAEQIQQAAHKWAILALAFRMFDLARKRFEENRQPAVVRRASSHFQRLTANRYREVRMPLDGSALNVLPVEGLPKTTDQLSRGTSEQLYLALRFGFIEEFTSTRDPLPIIMDDILVNFDPGRVNATIENLLQLSDRFQILYFTCHPTTAKQFREIDSSVPVYELSEGQINTSLA